MVALLEVLDRNNVPYDKEEVIKRYDLFMKGLRRDPDFEEELQKFKSQKGGEKIPIEVKPSKDDFLGPQLRWIVEVMGSPYAQGALRVLFMVLFFVSYLESIPAFGSILSAGLDITLAGAKMMVKVVQKSLPPLFGVIPIPFSSIVGMSLAALFGMIIWPLVSMVSFSRQDFTAAIESYFRIIPPPLGDSIADTFLEANRAVNRLNEKRKKLVEDISNGIEKVMSLAKGSGDKLKQGANTLIAKTKEVAQKVPSIPNIKPELDMNPTKLSLPKIRKSFGGKTRNQRFSKKKTRRNKWQKK